MTQAHDRIEQLQRKIDLGHALCAIPLIKNAIEIESLKRPRGLEKVFFSLYARRMARLRKQYEDAVNAEKVLEREMSWVR